MAGGAGHPNVAHLARLQEMWGQQGDHASLTIVETHPILAVEIQNDGQTQKKCVHVLEEEGSEVPLPAPCVAGGVANSVVSRLSLPFIGTGETFDAFYSNSFPKDNPPSRSLFVTFP
jgi:hypothetical protein